MKENTRKVNILIEGAGKRVRLVQNFEKYFNVFTSDINPELSAACQYSKKYFKVPPAKDPDYIEKLLDICKKNNIKIVIPTFDILLSILADNKDKFLKEGILLLVSNKEICDTFFLKDTTEKFFIEHGFKTPEIIEDLKNAKYPIFAKLNDSYLSIGAQKINSYDEIKQLKGDYIFQEYIDGTEYTIDAFFDDESNLICAVPRERIQVRCGEVNKARTRKDKKIIDEIKKLAKHLKGAYGCLTIQLFKRGEELIFIEINPRFGGGYPLSFLAGADYAKYIKDIYDGKKLDYFEDWQDNLIMLRYDAEVLA